MVLDVLPALKSPGWGEEGGWEGWEDWRMGEWGDGAGEFRCARHTYLEGVAGYDVGNHAKAHD